jgi:hypothetical protein
MKPKIQSRAAAAVTLALTAAALLIVPTVSRASRAQPLPQRFTLSATTIRGVDKPIHVVAAGPISGIGTLAAPKHASRHERLTIHFAKGSVSLLVAETFFAAHPNFRTCSAKMVGRGTFKITGGSGSFHGATGKGTFNRHSTMIGERSPSGACAGKNTPPKAVYTTSALVGKATLATG